MIPIVALSAVPLLLTQRRVARNEFVVEQTPTSRERWYLQGALLSRVVAKEIRAFDAGPLLRERYDRSFDRFIADATDLVRRQTWLGLLGTALVGIVGLGAIALLVVQLEDGSLGIASAGAVLVSVQMLAGRTQQLAGSAAAIFESSLYLADLDDFVAARAPAPDQLGVAAPSGFPGLTAENLCYTYPGTGSEVLHEVELQLEPGEVVALVGENGSGKTTLAKIRVFRHRCGSRRGSQDPDGAWRLVCRAAGRLPEDVSDFALDA